MSNNTFLTELLQQIVTRLLGGMADTAGQDLGKVCAEKLKASVKRPEPLSRDDVRQTVKEVLSEMKDPSDEAEKTDE